MAFCEKDSSKTEPKIQLNDELKAPIKKGDVVGIAKYTIDDDIYEVNLIAENDVDEDLFFTRLIWFIVIAFLVYIVFKKLNRKKKKKKKKKYAKKKTATYRT